MADDLSEPGEALMAETLQLVQKFSIVSLISFISLCCHQLHLVGAANQSQYFAEQPQLTCIQSLL